MAISVQKDTDKFWRKVAICGEQECWNWEGTLDHDGYGVVYFAGAGRRAHRVAFALFFKRPNITSKQHVCHTCGNRRCCNPYHLVLASHADNMHDRKMKMKAWKRG